MMSNPFTAHPHAVNETYFQHLAFALKFGIKMTFGGMAAIVHAAFPFLFVKTAGRICDALQAMRAQSAARQKNMPQISDNASTGTSA
jgi:hypothetical protein